MDKEEYIRRFDLAAQECRDFARSFVIEDLPEAILFDVALRWPPTVKGKIKYIGGRLLDPASIRSVPYVKARKMFWVDGKVPRWINMQVSRVEGNATVIEIATTDKLTSKEDRLMHAREGNPPFHVLGPWFPRFGWSMDIDGKFRLRQRG